MKVKVVSTPPAKRLADIPNGVFFTGTIDGYVSQGPFLKVGSVSERLWVVVKLESMEGGVWLSTREKDRNATVRDFQQLVVSQVVLRDHEELPSVVAVDPVGERVTG